MDSPQSLSTASTRKVFWWNPHLLSFKELVRETSIPWVRHRCSSYNYTVAFHHLYLFFIVIFLFFVFKVELYSNNTRTSSYGWPLFLCNWKHHGGVWGIIRSTSNVWLYYLLFGVQKLVTWLETITKIHEIQIIWPISCSQKYFTLMSSNCECLICWGEEA